MRTIKKLLAVCLCLAFSLPVWGAMTGCSRTKGDLTVLMLVNDGSDIYYEEKFKQLGEELGITINYTGYAFQDYDMQLRLAMNDVIPDIFYIRPNQIKSFVADGLLADLGPYIEQNVDMSGLIDNFNAPFTYDGKNVGSASGGVYAVNGGFSYQGLAYNKVLLERCKDVIADAGLKMPYELGADETYTWDEFKLLLDTIDGMPVGGATGQEPIGGMDMPAGGMMLQAIMNFGGDVIDDGTVTVDTPAVKACLDFLLEAHTSDPGHSGYISADYSFPTWKGQKLAFYTASGTWEMAPYGEVEDVTTGSLNDANVDFMPWPTLDGKYSSSRQLIGGAGYAVSASSDNLELAKRVATALMEEDVLDELCYKGMALPMTKRLSQGEYLTDEKFHPDNKRFLIDVITGKIGETSPLNNCYSVEWYDTFTSGLDVVWNGKKSVADYVAEKQTNMQEKYDKYNKLG